MGNTLKNAKMGSLRDKIDEEEIKLNEKVELSKITEEIKSDETRQTQGEKEEEIIEKKKKIKKLKVEIGKTKRHK